MSSATTPTFDAEQQLRVDALHVAHGILAGGAGTIVVGSAGLTTGTPAAPRDFDIITDLIELAEYIQTGHELVHFLDTESDEPSMIVHRIDLAAIVHSGGDQEDIGDQLRAALPQGVLKLIGADEADNVAVRFEVRVHRAGPGAEFEVFVVNDATDAALVRFDGHAHVLRPDTVPVLAERLREGFELWLQHRGLGVLEDALTALDDELFTPGRVKDADSTPPDVAPEGHIVDPLEQDSTEGEAHA
jgi:hypothetical protein